MCVVVERAERLPLSLLLLSTQPPLTQNGLALDQVVNERLGHDGEGGGGAVENWGGEKKKNVENNVKALHSENETMGDAPPPPPPRFDDAGLNPLLKAATITQAGTGVTHSVRIRLPRPSASLSPPPPPANNARAHSHARSLLPSHLRSWPKRRPSCRRAGARCPWRRVTPRWTGCGERRRTSVREEREQRGERERGVGWKRGGGGALVFIVPHLRPRVFPSPFLLPPQPPPRATSPRPRWPPTPTPGPCCAGACTTCAGTPRSTRGGTQC